MAAGAVVDQLQTDADLTERIVAAAIRAIRRRRAVINSDKAIRSVSVSVRLYASSGKLRSVIVDLSSEEDLTRPS